MSSMAMPISRCNCFNSSRICAWIVTSSAVVGSSAMSRSGSLASAMAIMTRWRWPPDNWCGKASSRFSGSRMPTLCSSSSTRTRTAFSSMRRCTRSTSPTCRSMVCSGLSDVIGSWKIIEMRSPRTACSCCGFSFRRSLPSNQTSPDGCEAEG